MVPVELARIIISENKEAQVIVLREKGGDRLFPIVIGIYEAVAIDRKIKELTTPRPLTHDLIHNVILGLGGRLKRIFINDIKDNTFYAQLVIERSGADVEIDARPSDAVALAVQGNTPIFVAEHVIDRVGHNLAEAAPGGEETEEPAEEPTWKPDEDDDEDDEDDP